MLYHLNQNQFYKAIIRAKFIKMVRRSGCGLVGIWAVQDGVAVGRGQYTHQGSGVLAYHAGRRRTGARGKEAHEGHTSLFYHTQLTPGTRGPKRHLSSTYTLVKIRRFHGM